MPVMGTRRLPLRKRRRPSSWSLGKCLLVGTLCGMLSMITYGLLRFPLRSSLSAPAPPQPSTAETTISVVGSETKPTTDCRPLDSHADITTKGLYDSILFDDIDGGVWKQGWEVKYRGDEWNQEKLKVFVVPHSHNDPGWLRTVEEYYKERTVHIFASIIKALDQDPRRKFIWEEISYLQRWWQDASLEDKALFSKFVKNGQLEIVGGGWVMNDEANSHFYAITEQITEGNVWLWDTFGVRPKNAWAIDPFGHSSTMAYLLRRMGFENMLIQRVHYEVKKALARSTSLEFFWRQSWDRTNATDMFCHMMPFYSYDVPHTCGPEPAVCCQFDFARLPSAPTGYSCPWNIPPQEITMSNVKERAELLLDQYRKKSTLYRTNTVLIPLGDDFRYTSSMEADLQFRNYEALFEYINSHPGLHAQIQWGTLEDYFSTLRKEVGRRSTSMQAHFPTLSGDFFTYADRVKDYWSGYYVSRPFFKAVDRVLEETLRAAEILFSLDLAYGRSGGLLSQQFASPLVKARRNLALFQHHDGITGTARDHVVVDYGTRMHSSLADLQALMAAAAEALLRPPSSPPNNSPPSSLKMLEPEQTRSRHDVLSEHTPLSVARGGSRRIVVYNPIAHRIARTIYVAVPGAVDVGVCVLDSALHPVASQLSPDWAPHSGGRATGRQRLYWVARVPPLGLETYFVVSPVDHKGCMPAKRAVVEAYNAPKGWKPPGGGYSAFIKQESEEEAVSVSNRRHRLVFDAGTGLLKSVGCPWGGNVEVAEEFALYSSIESGAYLFMPLGPAAPIVRTGGLILVSRGDLVQEVMTEPAVGEDLGAGGSPIVRWARVYAEEGVQGSVVEMQHHVNLERRGDLDNKELVVRYRTGLESGNVFYSDLNGFQTMRRERYSKIPTQGNFYPMPAHAFLEDAAKGVRFTVHTRQAVGVASLESGWLEMMLDRRLVQDDHRGLEQGVTDNHPTDVVFHLLLENINPPPKPPPPPSSPSSPLHLSLLSNLVSSHLAHPFHAFLGSPQSGKIKLPSASGDALSTRFAPLASDEGLPCDLHLLNLKTIRPEGGVAGAEGVLGSKLAGTALLVQRHGLDCSFGWSGCSASGGKGFAVDSVFKDLVASEVVSTSLNLVHDGKDSEHLESGGGHRKDLGRGGLLQDGGVGTMEEMEVRALKFNLGVRRSS